MLFGPRTNSLYPQGLIQQIEPAIAPVAAVPEAVAPGAAAPEAAAPYQWGASGSRLTPEDIARQRKQAEAMRATGMDYSPIQHWTQGLSRVAQGLIGGLEENQLDKESAKNTAYNDTVAQALIGGNAGAGGAGATGGADDAALVKMMSDPRVSDGNRKLAQWEFEQNHPKPAAPDEFERMLARNHILPGTPEYAAAAARQLSNSQDPLVNMVIGGNTVVGPRSEVEKILGGNQIGAAPAGGGPAAPPAPQIIAQKPAGMTDDQIWAQAHQAVRDGANVDTVFRQLQAWGMKP